MTTINIELRNLKYMASLSEETNCYSADLYLDGKKVAAVSNRGHGGCDEQYFFDQLHGVSPARDTIEAYFKSLPERDTGMELEAGKPFMVQPDLEDWCGQQVTRFLVTRDVKRAIAKKVTVVHPDGVEYAWKLPPSSLNETMNFRDLGKMTGAEYILAKSPKGSRIVNLMTPDELTAHIERLLASA